MAAVKKFEDLEIWQLARIQVKNIYQITFKLSPELAYQIRRSSASVMDNIAEGFARGGRKEFKNFLIIAKGSNAEVRSQLYRISDLEFSTQFNIADYLNENDLIGKKINTLISYLKLSDNPGSNY